MVLFIHHPHVSNEIISIIVFIIIIIITIINYLLGGSSWTLQGNAGDRRWKGIASDSTGMLLVAVVDGEFIYRSTSGLILPLTFMITVIIIIVRR